MQFKEIIGYESTKQELLMRAKSGKIPHNILLEQQDGMPGIPMALAFFQYINCQNPSSEDSCGVCRHCEMINALAYPDLHFIYPVVSAAGSDDPSGSFFPQWQEMVLSKGPFFSAGDWLEALNAENSRPVIYSGDAAAIEEKLNLHISENGYRMVMIYQPERMREEMANKLLKLMEEPPTRTLFFSVSLDSDLLLETVLSRMQRIEVPPLSHDETLKALEALFPKASPQERLIAAERAEGILSRAVNVLRDKNEEINFTKDYSNLLRHIENREVFEFKRLAQNLASKGREYVISFLGYVLVNLRFAFRCTVDGSYPRYSMSPAEQQIERHISGWITPENIRPLYDVVEKAIVHIKGNVMTKLVLFDLFLELSARLIPAIKLMRVAKLKNAQVK